MDKTELTKEVNQRFPEMNETETWEEYLDRKKDDLSADDVFFLEKAIKSWWDDHNGELEETDKSLLHDDRI